MVGWKLFSIALLFLCPLSAAAQYGSELTRSPENLSDTLPRTNYSAVVFDKFLNTYHWTGALSLTQSVGAVGVRLREQLLSTLIRADRDYIKDEQSFDLSLKHRWSSILSGSAEVTSFILADDRGIGISNASSHAAYGGVEYGPFSRFLIEPLIGYRFDNQVEQRDRGASYLLRFSLDTVEFGGYRTAFGGRFQFDQLSPRQLETHTAAVSVDKRFFEQTRNSLRMLFTRNQRDFYTPTDSGVVREYGAANNIERRSENAFAVSDRLDYNLGSRLLLGFGGNIFTRGIGRSMRYQVISGGRTNTFNTSIGEFKIDGSVEARYEASAWMSAAGQFFYQERDEHHSVLTDDRILPVVADSASRAEERKNNHSRRVSLSGVLSLALSPSDSLLLSGSTTLLRYDTPSAENDDDRDELWDIVGLGLSHRFNSYLSIYLFADADLTHLVYLLSSRSADNTWNRVFRLSPRLEYRPSGSVFTSNTFEVLANYTVYDYEYPSSLVRSFVFRQFSFADSTGIDITRRFGVDWTSSIRFYERGEFQWDAFSERPVNYFEEKAYTGAVRFRVNNGLLFSCGIRYFSQTRFMFSGSDRILETFIRSIGPVATAVWHVADRTDLALKGWFERQSQTNQLDRNYSNMTMSFTLRL